MRNQRNERDPAVNVLYNMAAMEILRRARAALDALGLHTTLGPAIGAEEHDMAASLAVSTEESALIDRLVRMLVVDEYLMTPEGKAHYQRERAEFLTRRAILDASEPN